jgi:spiro-SPASM protein
MKTAVVLFADPSSRYMHEKAFGGKSAFECVLSWASSVPGVNGIYVLAGNANSSLCREAAEKAGIRTEVQTAESWTVTSLLHALVTVAEKSGSDAAVYSYADCPFLDEKLTAETVMTHEKYRAEYTFADGYPYGLSPEVIDKGAAGILASLSETSQKAAGTAPVSRTCIYDLLKTDINSFEIETVLAPKDWRLYRFSFECGTKAGFTSCRALYGASGGGCRDAETLSETAARLVPVLRTVPAFYNVQIEDRCGGTCAFCPYPRSYEKKFGAKPSEGGAHSMDIGRFKALVRQMVMLSGTAVVGLSAWGEPLLHPDFAEFVKACAAEDGLSVMVETDGLAVTEQVCEAVRSCAGRKIIWIVSLDAVTEDTYRKMHGGSGTLAQALSAVALLEKYFPGNVYPQMVRTQTNECELEKFYRLWKDENSPSCGKVIIQKYDNFAGFLPSCKPADLSPLERNPCWHLRRDMTILADGRVPICREYMFDSSAGNAFEEPLDKIWEKLTPYAERDMKGDYDEKCRNCDEYYTFNF